MSDIEFDLIDSLKRLVRSAMYYAIDSHKYVFESDNIHAAIASLQRASAKMAAAESLYYARFDVLARDGVEDIFQLFDTFSDELIENFATDHSHQWTDIEFTRLKEAFDDSPFAFENK